MDEILDELKARPDDWELRCKGVQRLFERCDRAAAAALLCEAPRVPFERGSVLFAASVLASEDPPRALRLLEGFLAAHPPGTLPDVEAFAAQLAECGQALAVILPPLPTLQPAEGGGDSGAAATPSAGDDVEEGHSAAAAVWEGYEGEHGYQLEHEGGRAFIVMRGEAVRPAEQEASLAEKLGSVGAALVVHVLLVLLLLVVAISTPPPPPPQITATAVPNADRAQLDSSTLTRMKHRASSAQSVSQPVVASHAFSNLAIPENFDTAVDLSMVAMSDSDAGFGMSLTGFGDVANMGAIPEAMRSRCSMSQRMARLRESGGDDRAERAVRRGLEFLATKQNPETGAFGEEYTAGVTGLALLAYLGHCQTPESPKFGDTVVRAATFLMERCLTNDGKITNGKRGHHEAYEHAIGTYALAELYTMTRASGSEIPRLESVLRRATGLIVDAQTRNGGWPYGFSGQGKEDMSVSGWQVQALKAAYNTGRSFPGVERALDRATLNYMPSIQDSEGAFKYNPDHARGKASLTGAALLSMQIWKGVDSDSFKKGFEYLAKTYDNPSPGSNYYVPYYNTQVFFLAEGPEWENYNSKFQPRLLDAQNEDGSWLSDGGGRQDSQLLNTAWACLMLEVYYRYLPTTDRVTGMKRR